MENLEFGVKNPAGLAFEDLSIEEMIDLQGSGDVHADSTPIIATAVTGAAGGLAFSIVFC
jgi:type 2 lantibiotic (TIGR03893 family)